MIDDPLRFKSDFAPWDDVLQDKLTRAMAQAGKRDRALLGHLDALPGAIASEHRIDSARVSIGAHEDLNHDQHETLDSILKQS